MQFNIQFKAKWNKVGHKGFLKTELNEIKEVNH